MIDRCPCGSAEVFDECCGRHLGADGVAPPTAEALMRSRYAAFVRGDVALFTAAAVVRS